ncbi:MAG TPA: hypothetical protein RMG45_08430, partial [Polyangiaceae bacterium LLY-WYZ-15_(1-7)]|nr:hypothetical protein [Polyangiaceae bacterium LLY-WYZ-15_(1-7)]
MARQPLALLRTATLRTATLLLAVLLATALAGCDRAPACAPGACPSGTVCELDGTCRPLADRDALRFTRALRLAPTAWGATRRDRRSEVARDLDEWALGGGVDGTVHLRFPLPEEGEIMAAVLALWPAPGARPEGRRRVVVARTAPFDPATLQRRLPARRVGRA